MKVSELTSRDLRIYAYLFPDATPEAREKHFERMTPEQWAPVVAGIDDMVATVEAQIARDQRKKSAEENEADTARAFGAAKLRTIEHVKALNTAGAAAIEHAKALQASAVLALAAHDEAAALGVSRISQRAVNLGAETVPDSREAIAEARREIQVLERATGEVLFQLRQLLKEGA